MTCPHASTTTVAWMHGEGPEEHLHHVVGCADCAEVLEVHADVMSAVAPVAAALRPRSARRWGWAAVAVAVAAAGLLCARVGWPEVDVAPSLAASPVVEDPFGAPIDDALDDLDLTLASLEADLQTL